MLRLPTCVLRHQTAQGSHFDWLLMPVIPAASGFGNGRSRASTCDPKALTNPDARLWTGRVEHTSATWAKLGRFTLQRIADHRPIYLNYQGPISGGRGSVVRVDSGWVVPLLWSTSRIVVHVQMRYVCHRMELRQLAGDRFAATVMVGGARISASACGAIARARP
jgi:hypothetical protein